MADAKVISIKNAEHYSWGEQCDGWHLVKQDELSVIQERMPPGTSESKHYHNKARQFFYVLSGEAVMELSGKRHIIRKNEGIEAAPLQPHRIYNYTEEDLIFLVISQPKSHGDREAV